MLPLGTLTVEETKSPSGYLLEGAYMQAAGGEEQNTGLYITQITEDGELAILTGSNQFFCIRQGHSWRRADTETGFRDKGYQSTGRRNAERRCL